MLSHASHAKEAAGSHPHAFSAMCTACTMCTAHTMLYLNPSTYFHGTQIPQLTSSRRMVAEPMCPAPMTPTCSSPLSLC